jgi:hypothetical protein
MAQRVYLIVLDDQGTPEYDWFESVMKEEVLGTWNNAGLSEMGYVELTVSAEEARLHGREGDPRFGETVSEEMQAALALAQFRIAEDKN